MENESAKCDTQICQERLVIAALLGDLTAFNQLARQFRRAVVLTAWQQLRDWNLAEDVAQETLVIAFQALPQLQEPSRFAGWLHRIAQRQAMRAAQTARRCTACAPTELERLLLDESADDRTLAPDYQLLARETRDGLWRALELLDDSLRGVLLLYYFEEWPVARIADFLSLPTTTVKWRLHRGRELLRRYLSDLFVAKE